MAPDRVLLPPRWPGVGSAPWLGRRRGPGGPLDPPPLHGPRGAASHEAGPRLLPAPGAGGHPGAGGAPPRAGGPRRPGGHVRLRAGAPPPAPPRPRRRPSRRSPLAAGTGRRPGRGRRAGPALRRAMVDADVPPPPPPRALLRRGRRRSARRGSRPAGRSPPTRPERGPDPGGEHLLRGRGRAVLGSAGRADAASAEGDWRAAVRALQEIVEQRGRPRDPGAAAPWVVAVHGSRVYEGAWLVAHHRIAAGGAPALEAYAAEYGATAGALLGARPPGARRRASPGRGSVPPLAPRAAGGAAPRRPGHGGGRLDAAPGGSSAWRTWRRRAGSRGRRSRPGERPASRLAGDRLAGTAPAAVAEALLAAAPEAPPRRCGSRPSPRGTGAPSRR